MKKILVVLALLFSSVFANNINDCKNLAGKYFIQVARFQLTTIVKLNFEGRFFNEQEWVNMLSVAGTTEIVRIANNNLRKRGYYNAAIYIETFLNKDPNTANDFIVETFKRDYNVLMNNIKNNVFKNDYELESFIAYYKKENSKDFNEIVNKLDSCIYY